MIKARAVPPKPRQNRLCWLIQKRAEEQSCLQCLMARESEYTPLLKLTSRALEIDRHELTNRVKTSFTSVGNCAGWHKLTLRTWPPTGHEAKILSAGDLSEL